MSLKESENYLEHGIKPKCNGQILKEIDYFIDFYGPKKKLYIAYDRIAFFGKEDENLRLTFDCNIRSRTYDLDLKNTEIQTTSASTEPYFIFVIGYCM